MFCENCGKEIPEDAKFCPECETAVPMDLTGGSGEALPTLENVNIKEVNTEPVPEAAVPEKPKRRKKKENYVKYGKITGEKVTENIYLCPDGVYRWFYELNMLTNPTILFTVWKVILIAFGIVILFFLIMDLIQGVIRSVSDLWPALKLFAYLVPLFLVLAIFAYLIVAWTFGWKYIVLFEMDEERVSHIPTEKEFKKAQTLSWLTMLTAVAAKNRGAFSAGMLSGMKGPSTSIFKEVEYLRIRRKRHTIHVDQLLDKNQVYTEDADFDFVEKFIKDRCVKAKIC